MRFETSSRAVRQLRSDCLVLGAFERGELGTIATTIDRALRSRIRALLSSGDFSGRASETLLISDVTGIASPRVLLVGLGPKGQYNRRTWRRALSSAIGALTRTRIRSATLALERPATRELDDYYYGRAVAELSGAVLYRINDLKSARAPRPPALDRIVVAADQAAVADVRRGLAAGDALSQS